MTDLFDRISDAVERQRTDMVEKLMGLIRIRTEVPPGDGYDEIGAVLGAELAAVGFEVERIDMPDDVFQDRMKRYHPSLHGPRVNIVGRQQVENAPGMVFYTHMDTVPVGDLHLWSSDPLQPELLDGYVYGRGSADSKSGLVAVLGAFAALRKLGIAPAVRPLVAFTSDEEIGPYSGLMYLADTGVFDGYERFHSVDGMAENIAVGRLGNFTWSIRVTGRGAHTGRSMLGVNPIEHSVALLDELVQLRGEIDARRGGLPTSAEFLELTGRDRLSPSLNVTVASGGVKENVVPTEFTIRGDRRFLPEEDPDECVRELEGAIRRAKARDPLLECELSIIPGYPSHASDPDDPWVRSVQRVVSRVRGRDVPLGAAMGSSDTAHVGRVTDLVLTHHGVGWTDSNVHDYNERVAVDDMLAVAKMVAALVAGAAEEQTR